MDPEKFLAIKNCQDFCPIVCFTIEGKDPDNFLFIFWEKR